jgi:tRNA pseudouridine55 synthase
MGSTKIYRGTVRFGARSTTDDAEGDLTPVPLPHGLSSETVETAAAMLVGEVDQVPPAFSAIKVAGKPLYERARAGNNVEPEPRRVRIDRISIMSWSSPDAVIEVVCGKGTYIRSIARDLGTSVGTGAYLINLVRLASGDFHLEDSISIGEVERASAVGYLDRLLYPVDLAIADWPVVVLTEQDRLRVIQGGLLSSAFPSTHKWARAYNGSGQLTALLEYRDDEAGWRPSKVFRLGETNEVA